jgi:hypothetical protein
MNAITRWMLVAVVMSVMMAVAAPAFSAQATQIFVCEQDDDTSENDLRAQAKEWLKAARQMKGGAGLEAYLYFPVAVNLAKDSDFFFVIVAPSFEQWGQFWDGYQGSPAAEVDAANQDSGTVCPDSAVWESERVVLTAD